MTNLNFRSAAIPSETPKQGSQIIAASHSQIVLNEAASRDTVIAFVGAPHRIYDPTAGEIRSNRTDDIACWFIDTNYNEETFFERHAYFTGGDRPYEKLQKALRAEIDEDAWSALYSTVSRPFDPPETGKIAVKVINHYGDEVLKVYAV